MFSAIISAVCVLLFICQHSLYCRVFVVPAVIDFLLILALSYGAINYMDNIIGTFFIGIPVIILGVIAVCGYHIWVRPWLYVMKLRTTRLVNIEKEVFLQYGINLKIYQSGISKVAALPNKRCLVVSQAIVDELKVKDITNVMLIKSLKCNGYSLLLVVSILIPVLLFYFATQFEQYNDILRLAGGGLLAVLIDLSNRINRVFALRKMSNKINKEELLCSISRYYSLLNQNKSKMQQNFNNADKFGITRVINKI